MAKGRAVKKVVVPPMLNKGPKQKKGTQPKSKGKY